MAYKDFDGLSLGSAADSKTVLNGDGHTVDLPDASYVRDAQLTRDGMDLVLDGPKGELVIHDYFADSTPPNLAAPDGSTLTPELVNSFAHGGNEYAGAATINDETPVGAVQEVTGLATVRHLDGSSETIVKGTPIFQGDIIETDTSGAVNIQFMDDTSFAVSQDARLAIDEYVYDPATESGSTNFSVLKGVFVFTSGLIGRDDPDDVKIETPVGSIGIRGTIIAGNVDTGEITVVEGAIVLTDHNGHEMTLATQFETARFHGAEGIENMGQMSAHDVGQKFYVVSQVSPGLFSSINDAAAEQPAAEQAPVQETPADEAPVDAAPATNEDHSATQTTTTVVADAPAPVVPAVAPPVQAVSGLGTTSGLEVPVLGTSIAAVTTASSTTTTQAALQPAVVPNFIVADTTAAATTTNVVTAPTTVAAQDPSTIVPNTTTTTTTTTTPPPTLSNAPVFAPEAPAQSFRSAENQTWHYHFDKEFKDDGALTYSLSAMTTNDLNLLQANGMITSWTFAASNGLLDITFAQRAGYTTPDIFVINVTATDTDNQTASRDFTFSLYDANVVTGLGAGATFVTDNTVVSIGNTAPAMSNLQIHSDDSKFFFGDSADIVIIDKDNTSPGDDGSNNYVNLGEGLNRATVQNDAFGNTIVGGHDRDTVILNTAKVAVYGMDNDDDITLVLDGSSSVIADLATNSGTVIDGGHSNLRLGSVLRGLPITALDNVAGTGDGRGDSLILQSSTAATLNFASINANNKITGIERIDAATSTAAQTIQLRYADILSITDDKNVLSINLGTNDRLELTNMAGMTKVADDVMIDDSAAGTTVTNKSYDVFTDGNVTILVSGNTGTNVSLDGVNAAQ